MKLGSHVKNSELLEVDLDVVQIYIKNLPNKKDVLKKYKNKYFYIHSSLTNSLSCSVKFNKYVSRSLLNELEFSSKFKHSGVVIHPGTCSHNLINQDDVKEALNKIIVNISNLYKNNDVNGRLLLENCAGEGKKVPKNLDQIAYIIKHLELIKDKEGKYISSKVGICIDTCHLFAAGDYDLREKSQITKFKKDFETKIGLKYLKLIHLNDSKDPFNSHKDRHEIIGQGNIWEKENLGHFLECFSKVPMVCETSSFEKSLDFILGKEK